MKVIFLDVDGVLCTPVSHTLNRLRKTPVESQQFDPISLFWLRWLVHKTDAAVVLSSTWRDGLMMEAPFCKAYIKNLFERLSANGTPLSDVTPFIPHGGKSSEILAWLGCSPCEKYVILDDTDYFSESPETASHWVPIPNSRGLRFRQAWQALHLLQSSVRWNRAK